MESKTLFAALLGGAAILGGVAMIQHRASAATEDSWMAFRDDVASQCLTAAQGEYGLFAEGAEVTVDPYGSESYGLALIAGAARGAADTHIRAICVYDKRWKSVEIGGELPSVAP